eukprot:CAMPEP_0172419964 /NCGR_PEP_ID=MMETSP1064-20121228/6359_1 /TAXON_ID=202472 /ORGANISM="Aulacoseira subarctica , Strain CCAP 1002/5" /LENGTH=458 /DNA_ID=CAMNT_0013159683 /DNA_START=48 /DNA_END=1424 /DNA_ORIENTATION=-
MAVLVIFFAANLLSLQRLRALEPITRGAPWVSPRPRDDLKAAKNPTNSSSTHSRSYRFPSVDKRVRLYMSDWYLPPCPVQGSQHLLRFKYEKELRSHRVKNPRDQEPQSYDFSLADIPVDTAFSVNKGTISKCMKRHAHSGMKRYCKDVAKTVFPALESMGWNTTQDSHTIVQAPFLFQFGDHERSLMHGSYLPLPVIKKFRKSMTNEQLTLATDGQCSSRLLSSQNIFHGIIWKLGAQRHYNRLLNIRKMDVKWRRKKKGAVFRGALTGYTRYMKHHEGSNSTNSEEICMWTQRCRLVYQYANSTLLNARLTKIKHIPNVINGVQLTGKKMNIHELLSYKAIVFLEGNDVSSGLKWGLYSQSVVLMPHPTFTSWAMEELLEPWVHYIPINEDLSDVEEKIRWVIDHDKEANRISKRATQWIDDLVFHPDANKDDQKIYQEILRRYNYHWSHDLNDIF